MSHTIFHRHWVDMVCFQSAILERVLAQMLYSGRTYFHARRVLPLLDTFFLAEILHLGSFYGPTQYFNDIWLHLVFANFDQKPWAITLGGFFFILGQKFFLLKITWLGTKSGKNIKKCQSDP